MSLSIEELTLYFQYACDIYVAYHRRKNYPFDPTQLVDLISPGQRHFTWTVSQGLPQVESWFLFDVPKPTIDVLLNLCQKTRDSNNRFVIQTGFFVTYDIPQLNIYRTLFQ
jgi:hypothetical protein